MSQSTLSTSNPALDPNVPAVPVKQEIDDDQCRLIVAQPTLVLEIKSEPDDEAMTDAQATPNPVSQPTVGIKLEPDNDNFNCDCAECRGEVFVTGERIIDEEMIEVQEKDDDQNLEVKNEPNEMEPSRTSDYVPLFTSDDDDAEENTDEQSALPATPALKSHTCQDCSKSFSYLSQLRYHRRTHTGERPYKCSNCSKSFARRHHLVTHRRTHTSERPYKCQHCDKSFTLKGNLTQHQRLHTGEKPFKCNQCDQKFTQKGALTTHQLIHTGQHPFKCNQCDKCYLDKYRLNRHLRVHSTKNLL